MHPITEFCRDKNITYRNFARLIGASAPFVTQITGGHRKPSPALALRIEEATGGAVSRMELLYPEQKKGGQPNP
jgi:DNA-binding transcriptional regulator YdaS (Cro superfamily)